MAPFGHNDNGAWELDFTANHLWLQAASLRRYRPGAEGRPVR